jgi:xanthine dehydrogenase YagS FAD-binding subunit
MNPFGYSRAGTVEEAVGAVGEDGAGAFLAGGTTVVDLMRISVMRPERLVDISRLPLAGIEPTREGVRIGALTLMSEVAEHPLIVREFPAVSDSLLLAASPQLRNMATIGGNILQRTRCPYFRDVNARCNKREPGSGCDAIGGQNRTLAVLGTSEKCIAHYPGDLAVALAALDAAVLTRRPDGSVRRIPIRELHVPYGEDPAREHILEHGELITHVEIGASPLARGSVFLKVRDRASYEFALASAAVGLVLDGGVIRDACVALGGLASKPWHSPEAEAELRGKPATVETFGRAGRAAMKDAMPREHNGFKVELGARTVKRALEDCATGLSR